MKDLPTQKRAYVCKVPNRKARTSASSEYFQVFIEDSKPLLFTASELTNAAKRAEKNPEDIIPINFVDPVPSAPKIIEVPAKGIFAKLFQGFRTLGGE